MMRAPDIDGTAAHAWMVPLDRARAWQREHYGAAPDQGLSNTHAMYYVNGTGFNPFWSWWLVALMDLEQRPRQPVPVYQYGVAWKEQTVNHGRPIKPLSVWHALPEYELIFVTLDPKHKEPPVNGDGPFHAHPEVRPIAFQWHGLTLAESKQIAMFVVEALCAGRASGDPEIMSARHWQEILVRLVNDYRVGTFGGGKRKRLAVDPYTHRFTGKEVDDV